MKSTRAFAVFFVCLSLACASTETVELLGKEYYNLGNSYLELKKYPEASRAFKNALKYNPQLKLASFNLSRVFAEQGDFAAALTEIDSLLSLDSENLTVLKMKAWLLFKQGEKTRSAELWSQLAEKLPGEIDTQYNAGVALASVDRSERAAEVLTKWKELDGKTAPALKLLADVQFKLERWEDAEKSYRQAISTLPDSDPSLSILYRKIAEVRVAQKLYGDAVEAYQKALSTAQPDSVGALYFELAKIQLDKIEDYDAAWKSVQDAVKNGFRDAQVWEEYLKSDGSAGKQRLSIELRDSRLLQPSPSPSATATEASVSSAKPPVQVSPSPGIKP